jgi:hypothetical protein
MTNIQQYPFPDYDFLKKIFRGLLSRLGLSEKDYHYEWVPYVNYP